MTTIAQTSTPVRDDYLDRPDPWNTRSGESTTAAGLGARPLRVVDRHADPDALALAREAADRRAAASTRPVQRGTTRDLDRRKPRGMGEPVDGQGALFEPATPIQLALFGDSVPANEEEL